jgi:ATP-dependent DNA helicase DinG
LFFEVSEIFQDRLPSIWKDYEPRDSQIVLSNKIQEILKSQGVLLAEAGTGVGKSLSYLIPAAIYALENNSTVVVSTETKALQDQLLLKDIPLLEKILDIKIKAERALGASNYICKRKWKLVEDSGNFGIEMISQINKFQDWLGKTESGIKSEYNGYANGEFWTKVTREADNCLGKSCKNFSHSFYFLEKEKWRKAHILIVNHYLLASHIAGDFRILPNFDKIIIDEAHNFPEIVGRSFRSEITFDQIAKQLSFLYAKENKVSLIHKMGLPEKLINSIDVARDDLIQLYNRIMSELGLNMYGSTRIKNKLKLDEGKFENSLSSVANSFLEYSNRYSKESEDSHEKEIAIGIETAISRLNSFVVFFSELRNRKNPNLVYWSEPPNFKEKEKFLKLCSEPINVDEIISDLFIPKMESVIFTSATITAPKGDFSYFEDQIGFRETEKIELESPFNYKKQSLLFIPKEIQDPSMDDAYHEDILVWIKFLIELTQGNTFVLFTSNKSLKRIADRLDRECNYPIISQLTQGAIVAKQNYLDTENAVLLGVSSFWQGIDIKGDRLRSVIITKLPFQVPSEPVLETKIEKMKELNQNAFSKVQLPRAGLLLKQGFGRLIRSTKDTGIVSILDPRIYTKSYGGTLLKTLPKGTSPENDPRVLVEKYKNLPKMY